MKTRLTAEESAKLIELGVSPERASMCLLNLDYDSEVIPCEDVWEENGRFLANVNDEIIDVDRKIVTKDSDFDHSYVNDNPIFTLADILDILPKEIEVDSPNADEGIDIEDCYLCTQWCMNGDYADNHQWCAFYTPGFQLIGYCTAPELIDALYSLLVWCLEKGYVKLD